MLWKICYGHFQIRRHFFSKTILIHWYCSECSFPSQRRKCGWSWSLMVAVEIIWRIIVVENAHWIRVTKCFCTFSITNSMKNAQTWFFYRKRWFSQLFLAWIHRKGSHFWHVLCISFCESLKLNFFIFFNRVMKFYTFSWNCSYIKQIPVEIYIRLNITLNLYQIWHIL